MIASRRLRDEFRTLIRELAKAYGADARELKEAARSEAPALPKGRGGNRPIGDDAIVRRIARRVIDTGSSVRSAASVAAGGRRGKHARLEAAEAVLARKARRLIVAAERSPAVLDTPKPFALADRALTEACDAVALETDRQATKAIGARMRRRYGQKRPD